MLNKVDGLVRMLDDINTRLVTEKRQHAISRIDTRIAKVSAEIAKSGIGTAELSNHLLHPLQQLKASVNQSVSIAQIYQLQTETAVELEESSLDALHNAQAEAAKRQPPATTPAGGDSTAPTATPGSQPPAGHTAPRDKTYDPHTETALAAVNAPKPVARVRVSDVLSRVHSGVYLESQAEVDAFMDELRKDLEGSLSAGKRVQVR